MKPTVLLLLSVQSATIPSRPKWPETYYATGAFYWDTLYPELVEPYKYNTLIVYHVTPLADMETVVSYDMNFKRVSETVLSITEGDATKKYFQTLDVDGYKCSASQNATAPVTDIFANAEFQKSVEYRGKLTDVWRVQNWESYSWSDFYHVPADGTFLRISSFRSKELEGGEEAFYYLREFYEFDLGATFDEETFMAPKNCGDEGGVKTEGKKSDTKSRMSKFRAQN